MSNLRVVYVFVYGIKAKIPALIPSVCRAITLFWAVGFVFVFWNQQPGLKQWREHIPTETCAALVAHFFHHLQNALRNLAKLQHPSGILLFAFA